MSTAENGVQDVWVEAVPGDVRSAIVNRDGVWWHEAPKPPRFHRCKPQTKGWATLDEVRRCACGGVSLNGGRWFDRNSRSK